MCEQLQTLQVMLYTFLSMVVIDARTVSVPLCSPVLSFPASILVSLSVQSVRRRRRGVASQSFTTGRDEECSVVQPEPHRDISPQVHANEDSGINIPAILPTATYTYTYTHTLYFCTFEDLPLTTLSPQSHTKVKYNLDYNVKQAFLCSQCSEPILLQTVFYASVSCFSMFPRMQFVNPQAFFDIKAYVMRRLTLKKQFDILGNTPFLFLAKSERR